jgi:hypothetical protein
MTLIKKFGFIVSGLAALYLAYITATGEILNYIDFADPLNEMGFCICALMMGAGLLYVGFSKDEIEVPCSKELDNEWYNESI